MFSVCSHRGGVPQPGPDRGGTYPKVPTLPVRSGQGVKGGGTQGTYSTGQGRYLPPMARSGWGRGYPRYLPPGQGRYPLAR